MPEILAYLQLYAVLYPEVQATFQVLEKLIQGQTLSDNDIAVVVSAKQALEVKAQAGA